MHRHVNLRTACMPVMSLIGMLLVLLTTILTGPVVAEDDPDRVKVGVLVTSISGIDASDGSFDISAYAWFSAPLGLFDPDKHLQVYARDYRMKTVQRLPLNGGESSRLLKSAQPSTRSTTPTIFLSTARR